MIRPALLGVVVAALAALGCGGDSAGLTLVYPDSNAASRANTLSVYVFRPAATNLCAQLTQADNPLSPESTSLVREAASITQPAASDLDVLSNLAAGEYVFYAEVHDASGSRFLAGCVRARLKDGSGLRIDLEDLNPMVEVDAGIIYDADTTDAPPADAAPPPLLSVTVNNMRIPSEVVSGAEIIVSDGVTTITGQTDGSGRVDINVSTLTPPLTVTAAAGLAVYTSASTVVGVVPAFDGANATSSMRLALDLGELPTSGGGSISGTVTGLQGGDVATVRYRSPFVDTFAGVDASSGSYAIGTVPTNETYSLLLVRENGGSPTFAAANTTISVANTTPVTADFSGIASAIDVAANFNVSTAVAGLDAVPVFRSMVTLPRGPLEIETISSPAASFARNVARLDNSLQFSEYQFEAERASVDGSLFASAREVTTGVATAVSLNLPTLLPTIAQPSAGASIAVNTAQTLGLQFDSLYGGHDLVHVELTGSGGSIELRWHLVAPSGTTGITLPALPAGERVMQAGGAYDISVTPMNVDGSFDYDRDALSDFASLILATDIPLLARRTQAFTVIP